MGGWGEWGGTRTHSAQPYKYMQWLRADVQVASARDLGLQSFKPNT